MFKFVVMCDLHLTHRRPSIRKDDFMRTQLRKLGQLVEWSNEKQAPLLLGGDIFDTPQISFRFYNLVSDVLRMAKQPVVATWGQHDVLAHVPDLYVSPVLALYHERKLNVLNEVWINRSCRIKTFGFGEKLTTPDNQTIFNVMLAHTPVYERIVPPYMKDVVTAKQLKKQAPGYMLYVCGDIHEPFAVDHVVVSGNMLRTSKDKIGYKPRAYYVEVDNSSFQAEPLFFDIEEGVFNDLTLENTIRTVKDKAKLYAMMDKLRHSDRKVMSYKERCLDRASGELRDHIAKLFDEV